MPSSWRGITALLGALLGPVDEGDVGRHRPAPFLCRKEVADAGIPSILSSLARNDLVKSTSVPADSQGSRRFEDKNNVSTRRGIHAALATGCCVAGRVDPIGSTTGGCVRPPTRNPTLATQLIRNSERPATVTSLHLPSARRQAARDRATRVGGRGTAEPIQRPFVHVMSDDREQVGMGRYPRGDSGATCKVAGIAYTTSTTVASPWLRESGLLAPAAASGATFQRRFHL
jgi:hypothetical protein